MNYLKMVKRINVIVQAEEIEEQKKGLSKKKSLISMIENGEIRVRQMLQRIFNQL